MRAKGAWQTLALVLTVYTGTVGASCGNGRCDAQDYYACPQECASRTPPAPCPAAFGSLSQVEQDCIVKYATTYGCMFKASTRFSLPSSNECASVVGNTSCVFDWCFNACLSANACFEPAPTPACVPHCTTQSIGRISNGSAGAPLHCSPSCNSKNVGDGVCNLACMTKECYFDGGDCLDVAHISMPTRYNSNFVSSTVYLSSVTVRCCLLSIHLYRLAKVQVQGIVEGGGGNEFQEGESMLCMCVRKRERERKRERKREREREREREIFAA